MIMAHAPAVLEVLLNTPTGAAIAAHLFAPDQTIHVPHLIDVEIAQVLRRYARTGEMSDSRARDALQDYREMLVKPISARHPAGTDPGTASRLHRLRRRLHRPRVGARCPSSRLRSCIGRCRTSRQGAHVLIWSDCQGLRFFQAAGAGAEPCEAERRRRRGVGYGLVPGVFEQQGGWQRRSWRDD